MKISKPTFREQGDKVYYSVRVEYSKGSTELWYSLQKNFTNLLTDSADAALVSLLIPAMISGEDITIAGAISEKLHWNISKRYQHILKSVFPELNIIRISSDSVSNLNGNHVGVATGFSGGVDSYCTLADHHFSENAPTGLRLTHLVFNHVNSCKDKASENRYKLYQERCAVLGKTAREIGLPIIFLNSNQGQFYPDKYNFNLTCTPRNIAAALLLQGGIGKYLYSSSSTYEDLFVGPTKAIAYNDAVSVPLMSTEVMEMISVGNEYTRVQKTLKISEFPIVQNSLDVCVAGTRPGNCSICEKCCRTMVTLEIAGLLDQFHNCFDIEVYNKVKRNIYTAIIRNRVKGSYTAEIYNLAKSRDFAFSPSTILSANLSFPLNRTKAFINFLKHLLKKAFPIFVRARI